MIWRNLPSFLPWYQCTPMIPRFLWTFWSLWCHYLVDSIRFCDYFALSYLHYSGWLAWCHYLNLPLALRWYYDLAFLRRCRLKVRYLRLFFYLFIYLFIYLRISEIGIVRWHSFNSIQFVFFIDTNWRSSLNFVCISWIRALHWQASRTTTLGSVLLPPRGCLKFRDVYLE